MNEVVKNIYYYLLLLLKIILTICSVILLYVQLYIRLAYIL